MRKTRLADAYLDRPALRAAVQAALAPATARTRGAFAVVTGDGGRGKTQLAADVFSDALTSIGEPDGGYGADRVDLAVWVAASSQASIVSTYAQAYAKLQPEVAGASWGGADGGSQIDAAQQAEAFLEWLTTTDRAWLIVLDDVTDPGDLAGTNGQAGLWPIGPSGGVILTTRRRDAALGHPIDVDVFTPSESAEYLNGKLGAVPGLPGDVLDDAVGLANDLGHLPLALVQACAVIVNDAINCTTYRRLLAERTLTEMFPANPADSGDDYPHAVASAWALAADRANALAPVGLAASALALAATLDPNGVPENVFTTPAARTFLAFGRNTITHRKPIQENREQEELVTTEDARRAIRNLHRLSLLTHDPADASRTIRMHALTQRATLERLPDSVLVTAVRAAAAGLTQAWPTVENDPPRSLVLRANTLTLVGRHPIALWDQAVHPVLARAGRSLGEAGLVRDAVAYFTDLADQARRRLGPDHPHTLNARGNLANWREEAGDPASAATATEELLSDCLRVLGADHPETLTTRARLASIRGEAGDPTGAAAATEELLNDRLRLLGPDHPDTLISRHNLAGLRGSIGDPAGAATAFGGLLPDHLRVLGPDHPDTLTTRGNLANWRGQAGDPAGAATAYAELLTDRQRVLGPDHPETLTPRGSFVANIRLSRSGRPDGTTWRRRTVSTLADRTISALRGNHDELTARVSELDEEDLARQSGSSLWDVAQVLGHLGSGAEIALAGLQAGIAGHEAPGQDFTQLVWDRWNAMSAQEKAQGFLGANEQLVTAYESLDATARQEVQVKLAFLPFPADVSLLSGMRLNEAALHGWDVRVAFDLQATLTVLETAAMLEQLTGPLTFMLGFLANSEVLKGIQTTLQVETTDPHRVLGLVLGESVSLGEAPTDVGGVLTSPAEALLRLLAGRLDEAHTPDTLTITSNVVTLEQLRRVFPGL